MLQGVPIYFYLCIISSLCISTPRIMVVYLCAPSSCTSKVWGVGGILANQKQLVHYREIQEIAVTKGQDIWETRWDMYDTLCGASLSHNHFDISYLPSSKHALIASGVCWHAEKGHDNDLDSVFQLMLFLSGWDIVVLLEFTGWVRLAISPSIKI